MSLGTAVLAAYLAPPSPTWSSLLGHWSLDPLFVVIVLAAVLYLAGVRRLAERGRHWSVGRSIAFVSGLLAILVAADSGLAQYDRTLFSIHVVQHVLLGMVGPLLLVLGAPITLALQAARRPTQERLLRVLHSRPVALVTHPLVVFVAFSATLVVLYFTGLYQLSLENEVVHALVHVHFVVVGVLFMGCAVGIDPFPHRLGYGIRMLAAVLLLPFHAFLGAALLSTDHLLAPSWSAQVVRHWGPTALEDQRLGAGILWAAGELVSVAVLAIALAQWMRHEERAGARLDRRLDAGGVAVRN